MNKKKRPFSLKPNSDGFSSEYNFIYLFYAKITRMKNIGIYYLKE